MDKEQYDVLYRVEERHWWYLGMREITSALLSRWLNRKRPVRILDAGCGTGGMAKYLARFGTVYGVDVAAEALQGCRRRDLTTVARASVEKLPFASGSFDAVVSFDVLYHRAVVNDVAALAEFNRVLRPGGLVLVRVPAYDWLRGSHDVAVHTRHRYSRGELGDKLSAAGFRPRKLTYVNSLLFPLAAAKRLLEGKKEAHSDLDMPSPATNRLLLTVLKLEAALLGMISFPWGLSAVGVAENITTRQPAVADAGLTAGE